VTEAARRTVFRWRPSLALLWPDVRLERVEHITRPFLEERGLKGLILDLDNTLVPYGLMDEIPQLVAWARGLSEAGVSARLVSNAMPERVRVWSERLNIPGVGVAGKPLPGGFRRAMRSMGLSGRQVAVVGDQLFTDVLGGKLAGAYTILVDPLSANALPHTRFARAAERVALNGFPADRRLADASGEMAVEEEV
jgi:HAD superfamily phosphatase (TIGR01668 family)